MSRPSPAEFNAALARIWPDPEHARICREIIERQPSRAARIVLEAMEIVAAEGWPSDAIVAAFDTMCAELGIERQIGTSA